MNEEIAFLKDLSKLLTKHNANLCIERLRSSVALSFDIAGKEYAAIAHTSCSYEDIDDADIDDVIDIRNGKY